MSWQVRNFFSHENHLHVHYRDTLSRLDGVCLRLTHLCENMEYFILRGSSPVPISFRFRFPLRCPFCFSSPLPFFSFLPQVNLHVRLETDENLPPLSP